MDFSCVIFRETIHACASIYEARYSEKALCCPQPYTVFHHDPGGRLHTGLSAWEPTTELYSSTKSRQSQPREFTRPSMETSTIDLILTFFIIYRKISTFENHWKNMTRIVNLVYRDFQLRLLLVLEAAFKRGGLTRHHKWGNMAMARG